MTKWRQIDETKACQKKSIRWWWCAAHCTPSLFSCKRANFSIFRKSIYASKSMRHMPTRYWDKFICARELEGVCKREREREILCGVVVYWKLHFLASNFMDFYCVLHTAKIFAKNRFFFTLFSFSHLVLLQTCGLIPWGLTEKATEQTHAQRLAVVLWHRKHLLTLSLSMYLWIMQANKCVRSRSIVCHTVATCRFARFDFDAETSLKRKKKSCKNIKNGK